MEYFRDGTDADDGSVSRTQTLFYAELHPRHLSSQNMLPKEILVGEIDVQ